MLRIAPQTICLQKGPVTALVVPLANGSRPTPALQLELGVSQQHHYRFASSNLRKHRTTTKRRRTASGLEIEDCAA